MKIYSISTGEYSSYTVLGLYTNKDDAEGLCAILNRSGGEFYFVYVEEFGLDEHLELLRDGLSIYKVYMEKDGNSSVESTGYIDELGSERIMKDGTLCAYVAAKDEQHAVKIVNEKRVQLIASNQWPSSEESEEK